jgi:hypothetical protein
LTKTVEHCSRGRIRHETDLVMGGTRRLFALAGFRELVIVNALLMGSQN